MTVIGEVLGVLAGVCTAIAFLPQALQTIRTRNTKGLSLTTYAIYCTGIFLWIVYGAYLESLQMVVFNTICLFAALPILWIIIKNHKNNH